MSNFSKQDAIEDLKTIKTFFEEKSGAFPVSLEYAINFLESDVMEVVRCKDCVHYWKNGEDVAICLASPKDDAFCSDGERREDC